MDKQELLREICLFYNYDIKFNENSIIVDNGTEYGLNKVGKNVYCGHYEYNNINDGLKDWIVTLEETNKCDIQDNVEITWKNDILDFIKGL